jgi:redox-sensitive bicupin YhaK (pirin superfamily)
MTDQLNQTAASTTGKLVVRRSHERGKSDDGRLVSYHSFSYVTWGKTNKQTNKKTQEPLERDFEEFSSIFFFFFGLLCSTRTFWNRFGGYSDPKFNGFGPLRVINEDTLSGGEGFEMHPHANFEIFSYPLSGALLHQDSMNHKEVIRRGSVQHTSAGTGVYHSEFNASSREPVHFLQAWIKPHTKGLAPAYHTKEWSDCDKINKLCLMLSGDADSTAIKINAFAQVYSSLLEQGKVLRYRIGDGRNGLLHLAQTGGTIEVNSEKLEGGDAVFAFGPLDLTITSVGPTTAEFLFFDLPIE